MVKLISLDGNISSGKTTILQELNGISPFVTVIYEPIDKWNNIKNSDGKNILEVFYENQDKYSFVFQINALFTRYKLLEKSINDAKKQELSTGLEQILIIERSIDSDCHIFAEMLYEDRKINEIEYQVYKNWYIEYSKLFKIDKCIYIKANPITCYNRISKRARNGEDLISLSYLERIDDKHNIFYESILSKNKHLIISNDDDNEMFDDIIKQISNFIKE